MKPLALVAAALLVASQVRAQATDAGFAESVREDIQRVSKLARETQGGGSPIPTDVEVAEGLLNVTLGGMICQGSEAAVGPVIAKLLEGPGVKVAFVDQKETVKTTWLPAGETLGQKHVISLRKDIGRTSSRYLAIFLADAASEILDASLPDSGEKEYMRLSRMARAWLELGGDRVKLPYFGDVKDEATAGRLNLWIQSGDSSGLGQAAGKPALASLLEKAEKERDVLKARVGAAYPPIRIGICRDNRMPHYASDETALECASAEVERLRQALKTFEDFKAAERLWFDTVPTR